MASKDIKSNKYKGVYHRVHEDGTKTFYIVYKDPIEKKTKRVKVGTDKEGMNEAYAYNLKNEIITKARLGEDPNIPILKAKQHKETINDLAKNYIEHIYSTKGKTKSTKQSESRYNTHIAPIIGELKLSQLTKVHAKKIQTKLIKEGLSSTTINHIVTLLNTIINYNIKNDIVKGSNPLYGIEQLKTKNERTRYLSKEEIKLLLEHTKEDKILHLFTHLALSTGARLEGVLGIQKKDIDLSNGTIKINDYKSGGTYQGFINENSKILLEEHIRTLANTDYVVSYKNGERTEAKRIQRKLRPILNKLFNQDLEGKDTLDRVVIHTLRHTFASQLVINGTPLYTVMKLMNHKDIKTTQRYAKLAPNSGQEEVNNLF